MSDTKEISAPETFPKQEEEIKGKFVTTPRAGPHSKENSAPLGMVIRDGLDLADTLREVNTALQEEKVTVNGRIRKDYRFPVGGFDVVGVAGDHYRVLPVEGGFEFVEVPDKEADKRIVRIEDKTVLPGGDIQLNLSDGSNITAEGYNTGDSLVIKEGEVETHLPREEDAVCILTRGNNRGEVGEIKEIDVSRGPTPNTVTVGLDEEVRVPEDIVFVVGKNSPVIELGDRDGE